jgi:hypothetical protein
VFRVDGRVQDDPSTTSQLSVGHQVDNHGLLVAAQTIDDLGTLLEDRLRHVGHSTRETSEVGKDDKGEAFSVGVFNRSCSLARRVGEPDGTGERDSVLGGVFVGRVGRVDSFDTSRLGGDDGDGDTTDSSSTSDNGLRPATWGLAGFARRREGQCSLTHRLEETAMIQDTRLPGRAPIDILVATSKELSRIVWTLGRLVVDVSVPRIASREDRNSPPSSV